MKTELCPLSKRCALAIIVATSVVIVSGCGTLCGPGDNSDCLTNAALLLGSAAQAYGSTYVSANSAMQAPKTGSIYGAGANRSGQIGMPTTQTQSYSNDLYRCNAPEGTSCTVQ